MILQIYRTIYHTHVYSISKVDITIRTKRIHNGLREYLKAHKMNVNEKVLASRETTLRLDNSSYINNPPLTYQLDHMNRGVYSVVGLKPRNMNMTNLFW